MQKVEDVKTESVLRFLAVLLIFTVLLFTILSKSQVILRINNSRYYLNIASSNEQLARGLSGVENMPKNEGLLFVLPEPSKACFWMKQMNFNLDIIWLNEQKKVVYLEKNLSPKSYPKTYCSNQNSKYVIEMNSGFIGSKNIYLGEKLNF